MKNVQTLTALLAIVALCSVPVFGNSPEPLTVSPGATDRFTGVEVRCPTFSWQAVPGAVGYEVVVYELSPGTELSGWGLDEAVEVLFVDLPSGVTGWTPSLESGLARGADHVWFVRGVFEGGEASATSWSRARFFRVVGGTLEPGIGVQSREVGESSGAGAGAGAGEGEGEDAARSRGTKGEHGRSAMEKRVGEKRTKDVGTAMAAIRGEMPDVTGETYGVVGTSNSPDGAGLGAINTAGGPDLVLDGVANGDIDTTVSQAGIDRASSGTPSFLFTNSGAGALDVHVEGLLWADSLYGDGTNVTSVDAALFDGYPPEHYAMTGDLASPGGPSVHWDNLTVVPSGLDDGDDDTLYFAGTGLDLTGTVFSSMGTGFGNVVVVAASGGDFTSIQSAIDSISTASASNPFLVWVAPGEYPEAVTLKAHVHLQGAGQEATVINGAVSSSSWPPDDALLRLSSFSSVRDLTVSNAGPGTGNAVGLMATSGATDTVVADVKVKAPSISVRGCGVAVSGGSTTLTLRNVTALGEGGWSSNLGLYVFNGATATLHGGSFTGRGGAGGDAVGIRSEGSGTILIAENVTARGEDGGSESIGLRNVDGASATLRGGSFVGSGGGLVRAIFNNDGSLDAVGATVVGEGSGDLIIGLLTGNGSETVLLGGTFVGRGGTTARGIDSSGGTLRASSISVVGEDATSNLGLRVMNSSVFLATSQVKSGIIRPSGSLVCFQVYDDLFVSYSCPP